VVGETRERVNGGTRVPLPVAWEEEEGGFRLLRRERESSGEDVVSLMF
jgi:hypothetical protein